MMKKKKTDFEARFWSGTRKHSVAGLLAAFFQFNDLAVVKESLSAMVQCSVRRKARFGECPEEVFHLYLSLRSLVRAGFGSAVGYPFCVEVVKNGVVSDAAVICSASGTPPQQSPLQYPSLITARSALFFHTSSFSVKEPFDFSK